MKSSKTKKKKEAINDLPDIETGEFVEKEVEEELKKEKNITPEVMANTGTNMESPTFRSKSTVYNTSQLTGWYVNTDFCPVCHTFVVMFSFNSFGHSVLNMKLSSLSAYSALYVYSYSSGFGTRNFFLAPHFFIPTQVKILMFLRT